MVFGVAPRHILVSVAFVAIAYGLSIQPFKLVVNPVTRFIGTISFSGYIWHFWVLDRVAPWGGRGTFTSPICPKTRPVSCISPQPMSGTALCVLPLATASYYLIEAPGQNIGEMDSSAISAGALLRNRSSSLRHQTRATPALAN